MHIFLYLLREIFKSFLGVLIILLFIFLSGRLVKHLASAASGQFPSDIIFSIMLYRLPEFLEILLPLSLFLGLMLSFGRLYVESEMVVLFSCGVSKRRLLLLTLWVCLPIMLFFALVTLYLTPAGAFNYQTLWTNPANKMSFSTFVSGSFKRIGSKGLTVYAGELSHDKTRIRDVFVVNAQGDGKQGVSADIIKAREARLIHDVQGHQYLELVDGVRVNGGRSELDYSLMRFDLLGRLIGTETPATAGLSSIDATETVELFHDPSTEARARLQWRLGLPFMIPVLAILGLAFSETNHRRGRYIKLIPGIILYFIYFGGITFWFGSMNAGSIPTVIGFWPVHLVFLLIGLTAFYFTDIQRYYRYRFSR